MISLLGRSLTADIAVKVTSHTLPLREMTFILKFLLDGCRSQLVRI